jgi:hypothetical protein
MSGFGDYDVKFEGIDVKPDQVQALLKEYKKYNKYKKSNLFTIKQLSGDETIIKNLVDKYGKEEPLD